MCKETCNCCWRKQAQIFGLWCQECYDYLIKLYQDGQPHFCQARHADGELCGNEAQDGKLLCDSCETFYAGVSSGAS